MAELAKKLHFLKNGTEQTAKAYSTTGEAGSNYIPNKIDGVNCYIVIGSTSDGKATKGRVIKGGTTHAVLSSAAVPYAKQTYTTPGTYTFTVPSGVSKVRLTLAGGGGGGGNGTIYDNNDSYYFASGGNGGRGGLYFGDVAVSPNTSYSVVVGAGGAVRKAGGSSSFGSYVATGGGAGGNGSGNHAEQMVNGATGTAGTPVGAGGAGGAGGEYQYGNGKGSAGSAGWVYIEYGGDI